MQTHTDKHRRPTAESGPQRYVVGKGLAKSSVQLQVVDEAVKVARIDKEIGCLATQITDFHDIALLRRFTPGSIYALTTKVVVSVSRAACHVPVTSFSGYRRRADSLQVRAVAARLSTARNYGGTHGN